MSIDGRHAPIFSFLGSSMVSQRPAIAQELENARQGRDIEGSLDAELDYMLVGLWAMKDEELPVLYSFSEKSIEPVT